MFKKIKYFLAGAAFTLSCSLIIGAVYAYAGKQNISVIFDNIKVLFNESELELMDINGNEVEPFIYNGTTYIPIRAISENLGKQVDWDSENKTIIISDPEQTPMLDLKLDTHYVPLENINSDKITEKELEKNQIENKGIIFEKTSGYEKVINNQNFTAIFKDETGNYITVGETEQNGGYSDICIIKYDKDGNEIKRQIYGGKDFDMPYSAKYNKKMGIAITGISQSNDGDFAGIGNKPFVALIDADSLKIKWISDVQIADYVCCITDDSVYVVRDEKNSQNTNETKKLSVVKLDCDGKKVWQTEPLEQWITSIAELKDGNIIVVQKFVDETGETGTMTCYDKNGKEISKIKADCYGEITPTDDGGFISLSIRNIKTVPQPAYISAIWFDTETVVTKYDNNYKIEWRKTYDSIKDDVGEENIIPQPEGSIIISMK